jgi:hypothetical protein
MDSLGVSGFPIVKIGEEVIEGYNPDKYTKAMNA